MPPITFHMVLARNVAESLRHPNLAAAAGPYLLGSTTPDIRVITRGDRQDTHHFDLSVHDHQDSVARFFEERPGLADAGALNAETRAFVAGYLSHLVLDEQYITGIYRPFFARHDELGGRIRANVMDRLLQFGLDRKFGDDPDVVRNLLEALAFTVESIECGFIDAETLDRWRQVTADVAARDMDWDRARAMINRHLQLAGVEEGPELTTFLDSLPELENETIAFIGDEEITGFVERSSDIASGVIARYLECA